MGLTIHQMYYKKRRFRIYKKLWAGEPTEHPKCQRIELVLIHEKEK